MATTKRSLSVVGLFAGIGGVELGLERAGHKTKFLCELDVYAQAVLRKEFPDVPRIHPDVTTLRPEEISGVDLLAAGFPCQDLSLAGTRAGLDGERSGLVWTVMDLVRKARTKPEFLLFENVSNLLRLGRGVHMRAILETLEGLGYQWAYRVVDSRGFNLPQRRERVIILASHGSVPPEAILFNKHIAAATDDTIQVAEGHDYGFYWTEGKRGVGWARDAVPTIKGGSGLGIPSPPAVFVNRKDSGDGPTSFAGTPTIGDAERLQGFPAGWTDVELEVDGKPMRIGARWKMVGNAVSVPLAEWVGQELADPPQGCADNVSTIRWSEDRALPRAAFSSCDNERHRVEISSHVEVATHQAISGFLQDPLKPLSHRALSGYLSRAKSGSKKLPAEFLCALETQKESHPSAAA